MPATTNRVVIVDIETTGLRVGDGHRITELAAVEMINGATTKVHYQQYINPERELDPEAEEITGLTREFLLGYPTFNQVVDDFLKFLREDTLIIHNAPFDLSFINYQLAMEGRAKISKERVIDTLPMARQKFPGRGNSLDALCKRFEISLDKRNYHGGLVDCELLAQVYVYLMGGPQRKIKEIQENVKKDKKGVLNTTYPSFPKREYGIDEATQKSHREFISKNIPNHLWAR